jgi:PAS domain S-box-containing protein
MRTYVQSLAEYYRQSTQFYYLITDLQGKCTYANPLFNQNTGNLSQIRQFNFSEIISGQRFLDKYQQAITHCLSARTPVSVEFPFKNIGNKTSDTKWEFSPIFNEKGLPQAIQAIGFEVINGHAVSDELRYQAAMLENISDIIISCTNEHKVRSWNKMAESFYNIKAADALGKKITELVTVQYLHCSREEAHEKLYKTGSWDGEVVYTAPTGEKKYLLNHLSLVTDHEGERLGIMVIGKDITEWKLAEEKLQQSELFYRNLFADSLDGILLTNESGNINFASPSTEKVLGYDPNELVNRNAFEFVHPDDRELAMKSFFNEVSQAPIVKFIVIRLLRKSGEWVWCMVRGHNLLANPYVGQVAIHFYDDTLRKKSEDALKESEERFRRLISDLKFGVIMRDADGSALLCNKTVLDYTGLTEEEFHNTKISTNSVRFFREDNTEMPYEEHPSVVANMQRRAVKDIVLKAYLIRKDQWAWLLVNAEPVLNQEGELMHVITTFIDITERKELEEKLLREEISKQKIVTKATLEGQEKERKQIGEELHDNIGQQLTTTKLYLEIARATANEATLELISLATKSISDVINEVRNLSRALTPRSLGDLGLVESIKDLCDSIRTTQVFAIRFYHKNLDENGLTENLKLTLFRIIQEQINNILKHADATTILIRLVADAEQLMVSISDNGKGFDPYKVKKGLGINNIINRAEIFNGQVDIKTAAEEGCTLVVTIPLKNTTVKNS